jgi:hypothetical protein
MSDSIHVRSAGSLRPAAILLVLVAIAAWQSNPDEDHFRRWITRQLDQPADTVLEHIAVDAAAKVALAAADWERTNFAFFSLVTVHTRQPIRFLGAGGTWYPLGAAK